MTDLLSFQDHFEKGEYIIREGEEGNTFFIIAKGEVRYLHSLAKHTLINYFFFSIERKYLVGTCTKGVVV